MLDLNEVRKRIQSEKDWQSRSTDMTIFHCNLMLHKKKWSIRKTAKTLGMCASTVCEDLMLSRFILSFPELSKVRNRRDALKYLRENR